MTEYTMTPKELSVSFIQTTYPGVSLADAADLWLCDWHYGVPEGNSKCACDFDPRRGTDEYDTRCQAAFDIKRATSAARVNAARVKMVQTNPNCYKPETED
jgi:hypothetical protein